MTADWETHALSQIATLPGDSHEDMARRTLARRICRLSEVDPEGFPIPDITQAENGTIQMSWVNDREPENPCRLDIVINRGRSFRAQIWFPGMVADCLVVQKDWAEWIRRIFAAFWPPAGGHAVDIILGDSTR